MLIAPCAVSAQSSSAGLVLTLPTSTRALGLADASTAAAPDEWALFAAPAQLSRLGTFSAAVASEAYLASTRLSAATVAFPVARGTLAIGATMLDYGSINEIASATAGTDGIETGRTFSAQDNALVIGYGSGPFRGVRVGGAVEFMTSHVADLSGSAIAGSMSAAWSGPKGWEFVGAVQHVGSDLTLGATTASLPLTVRVAVAAPEQVVRGFALRPMAEVRNVRGAGTSAAGAVEGGWRWAGGTALALRAGYTLRSAEYDRTPVSLGVGASMGPFTLDYAVEQFRTIDQLTHRFGFRYARLRGP